MLPSVTVSQANSGRSPEADRIAQQYTDYYADINKKIHAIDSLPSDQRNRPSAQEGRAKLIELQKELSTIYGSDYNNSLETLASFQKHCALILSKVAVAFKKAIGQEELSLHDRIEEKNSEAKEIVGDLGQQIAKDKQFLDNLGSKLETLKTNISKLQQQIEALPDGDPRKVKAEKDLSLAKQTVAQLKKEIETANSQLGTLQGMLNAITGTGGTLSKLKQLSEKKNPDQSDLEAATAEMQEILNAQTFEQTQIQAILTTVNNQLQSVTGIIQSLQIGLQPPGAIEHGTWYIDWTSWDFPVPEGVNVVNIFVGNMRLDSSGKPIIDGFGNMDAAKMKAFVDACHAKGIAVKISIGGGGGSHDKCWDILTKNNVANVAQVLADFCHTNGLDGVDFDPEEFTSAQDRPEQQALVGTLIKEFKRIDPNFKTSICTNAGFGPYFPWQGIMKNFLDAASTVDPVTGKKTCAVDQLYIMSYYNTLSDEEHWVLGWAEWMKTEYNFTPSQITVGLDDTDAHAYDIKEFAAWAALHGFSTCYWEWNPATQKDSNKSTHDIEDSYNGHVLKYLPV
jgi:predicted  nucleic acid-binding Zn-ribbon protein